MSRPLPPEDRKGNSGPPVKAPQTVIDATWECPTAPHTVTDVDLWESIWELGGPSGTYNNVADFHLIRRYCEMIARREEMMKELKDVGWTEVGSKGQMILHPLARVLSDIEAKLVPIEDRLGLNPQSRNIIRIGSAQAHQAGSQMAQWIQGNA